MVAKTIRKNRTNEKVKLNSLKGNEEPSLNETADTTIDPLEAVRTIHIYNELIKTQNKRVTDYVWKQGKLLKEFRERNKFRIYFKIGLYKFLKKCPALKSHVIFRLLYEEF